MEEGKANVIDQSNVISEEDELQKAIAMSLEGEYNGGQSVNCLIAPYIEVRWAAYKQP